MAAKSIQEDFNHSAGLACSKKDCLLPKCINSKLGKMKTDTNKRRANKHRSARRIENGMNSASDTEENMELWWQDLQSLGLLEQPADGSINNISLFKETHANAIQYDRNHPQDQPLPALQSCRVGHEMHWVRDESQAKPPGAADWMGDAIPRSPPVQRSSRWLKSTEVFNRHLFSVSHPLAAEQAEPNRSVFTALSHDSQDINIVPLEANSSSHPQIQYYTNRGGYEVMGFETGLLEDSNEKKHNFQSSQYEHFKAWEFENASEIARKPSHRIQCTRKLFGTLSLIFQAFDDPYTAQLEEYYVHVLNKALDEIQEAKRLHIENFQR